MYNTKWESHLQEQILNHFLILSLQVQRTVFVLSVSGVLFVFAVFIRGFGKLWDFTCDLNRSVSFSTMC